MLSPSDNLILKIFTQVIEIVAVPGYPYNKVPVKLRVLLGIFQGVGTHNIELNVVAIQTEIAADQSRKVVIAFLIFKKRW